MQIEKRAPARPVDFDVIHFHIDYLHFPLIRVSRSPDADDACTAAWIIPDLMPLFREFRRHAAVVSISDDQRKPLPPVNWLGTVYHGLPR